MVNEESEEQSKNGEEGQVNGQKSSGKEVVKTEGVMLGDSDLKTLQILSK